MNLNARSSHPPVIVCHDNDNSTSQAAPPAELTTISFAAARNSNANGVDTTSGNGVLLRTRTLVRDAREDIITEPQAATTSEVTEEPVLHDTGKQVVAEPSINQENGSKAVSPVAFPFACFESFSDRSLTLETLDAGMRVDR